MWHFPKKFSSRGEKARRILRQLERLVSPRRTFFLLILVQLVRISKYQK
jgi:hypothetical protein